MIRHFAKLPYEKRFPLRLKWAAYKSHVEPANMPRR